MGGARSRRKPSKGPRSRTDNANDMLATAERGGQRPSASVSEYDTSGGRLERELDDSLDGVVAIAGSSASEHYAEFERLLAQRDEREPKPGQPKPERDTKRSVDARRLNNLGPLQP